MRLATLLLAMTALAGCVAPAAPSGAQPASSPTVTCSLGAEDCADALRAIERLPALDPAGLPPIAVEIVNMSECRAISGAPDGYSPCAAAMNPPADLSATGAGDAVASVTYRNGLGKAFLWLFWRTYASGRGPITAVLQASTTRSGGSRVATSPAAAPMSTPLPSGGITKEEAVSIAEKAAPLGAVFESVQAEPFSSVDPVYGEGLLVAPDREVWVVMFAATAAPCAPGGSTCESPRPGTVAVVIDYLTGERYVTAGYYPNP